MGGWGISDSAPETEKLKAEMNDLLMGLNSCAEIDILTYDKLYTFLIDELFEEIYNFAVKKEKAYFNIKKMKNEVRKYLDELDHYDKITDDGYSTLYNFTMKWIEKIYRLGRREGKTKNGKVKSN